MDAKISSVHNVAVKTIACALLVLVAACQTKDDAKAAPAQSVRAAAPESPYAKDIEALCDVIKRSGADKDPDATMVTVATWLAANMTTPESKQFLARIQPLQGNEKATALENEAKRVGLDGCALAAEWRTPAP